MEDRTGLGLGHKRAFPFTLVLTDAEYDALDQDAAELSIPRDVFASLLLAWVLRAGVGSAMLLAFADTQRLDRSIVASRAAR